MSTAIARNLMAEMKLPGMLAAFDKTVTDATRDAVSYTEFLDALLQAEADYRGERAAQRRLKAANGCGGAGSAASRSRDPGAVVATSGATCASNAHEVCLVVAAAAASPSSSTGSAVATAFAFP